MFYSQKKAFTIIELIVVVAILGVLATAIVLSVANTKPKARNAKRKADLDTVRMALIQYADENNDKVPAGNSVNEATTLAFQNLATPLKNGYYLENLPKDPKILTAGALGDYQYRSLKSDGGTGTTSTSSAVRFDLVAPSTEGVGSLEKSIIVISN